MQDIHAPKRSFSCNRDAAILAYMLPFCGAQQQNLDRHYFADHSHAKNFIRYMYSMSGAHRKNILTKSNWICEFEDGQLCRPRFNDNPNGYLNEFLRKRFPEANAEKTLCDDGCYIMFVLRFPNGRIVTNMLDADDDGLVISHPYIGQLEGYYSIDKDVMELAPHLGQKPKFEKIGAEESDETMFNAERCLHLLANKYLGGRSLLSVSHLDQPEHNPEYHIHRLLFI